jgi:homoserine O-acetyltransferase
MVTALENRFAACPGWNGGHYYGSEDAGGIRDKLAEIRTETLRGYGVDRSLLDALDDEGKARAELERQARQWAREFDANSLIVLRKALVGHDIGPRLAEIEAPLLYVLSRTDTLFPPELAAPAMRHFAEAGIDARYHEIDSEHGHAAPRTAWAKWAKPLADFLATHAG